MTPKESDGTRQVGAAAHHMSVEDDSSVCQCGCEVTLKQAQAVAEAAERLLDAGCLPIFDRRSLRAAWKLVPESRPALKLLASRYHQAGMVPR